MGEAPEVGQLYDAALLGGKMFVGNGPRRVYNTDFTDVQPRFGLAWQFEKNTVLRTGFGIYYRKATQANYTDGFSQPICTARCR